MNLAASKFQYYCLYEARAFAELCRVKVGNARFTNCTEMIVNPSLHCDATVLWSYILKYITGLDKSE